MSVEPKPFQQATIEVVVRAFGDRSGSRRFLVADEVGLGKTIVARGAVERLSRGRASPLRVFYVCSNLSIARQNRARLVSFLPEDKRRDAVVEVDRPSLVPANMPPAGGSVQVFSLTPDTALPSRGRRRRSGRVEERALGLAMLEESQPRKIPGLHRALRLNVNPERFNSWVGHYRKRIRSGEIAAGGFRLAFLHALRMQLGLEPGQHLLPRIKASIEHEGPLEFVAAVRSALAIAAMKSIRPDLVIFDEFQRFRDLLEDAPEAEVDAAAAPDPTAAKDAAASRVLLALRGDGLEDRPALLLLSATPYTPYRGRQEGDAFGAAAEDFFVLLEFLYGGGRKGQKAHRQARSWFDEISEELRKGEPLSDRARSARTSLTALLTKVMSRTERAISRTERTAGAREEDPIRDAPLLKGDALAFRHFKESLCPDDYAWAVPLWDSVPLPMQTLGRHYQAWRKARALPARGNAALTPDMRQRLEAARPWPHPRLRALLEAMPLRQLALPWIRPSLPWWPLEGEWKDRGGDAAVDGKLLVFSRFHATPSALSGLVSYALEARRLGRRRSRSGPAYGDINKRSHLAADPDRPGLLALFHPSPLLAQVDPLARRSGTFMRAKVEVQRQLRALLEKHGIRVVKHISRKRRRPWELLAMAEERAKLWSDSRAAWEGVISDLRDPSSEDTGNRLEAMVRRWNESASEQVDEIDDDGEFKPLTDLAIKAPGVVLARALCRHWPEALGFGNLGNVTGLCWRGLRSYFDAPWFFAALSGGQGESYPEAVREAVVQGNLESVLDEHFWYLAKADGSSWKERLEGLEASLRLRTSSVVLHEGGPGSEAMRLRCHAAVPLSQARAGGGRAAEPSSGQGEAPGRPEEVRRAFNAPFWPHMLITTSIGQEGLDFHPWCRSLAHWDLSPGPVAQEQREGRIKRFAGLSVRRSIAAREGTMPQDLQGESPWWQLAKLAEDKLADSMGLKPWWVAPGATTENIFLFVPGSQQRSRLEKLNQERALYRLVFGMPDQADLLELISAREEWDSETVRQACLDLSPWREGGETRRPRRP